MTLADTIIELAHARIGFSVHYPGEPSSAVPGKKKKEPTEKELFWVITVSESLVNDQLKVVTELGGILERDGIVRLIGKGVS